jgi:hypothetical protein
MQETSRGHGESPITNPPLDSSATISHSDGLSPPPIVIPSYVKLACFDQLHARTACEFSDKENKRERPGGRTRRI